jgi:DNA-binding MarR family transcriptional regulator
MNNRFETFTLLITSISRSIRRIKTETMAQYELKSPHVSCLYYLYKKPGMTAAELCEVCEEDKAAVSRSILFLEQKGYLAREISADKGGRSGAKHYRAPLSLTEEGRRIAGEIAVKVDHVLEAVSQGVSEEERGIMYTTLERINRNLRGLCEEYGDDTAFFE